MISVVEESRHSFLKRTFKSILFFNSSLSIKDNRAAAKQIPKALNKEAVVISTRTWTKKRVSLVATHGGAVSMQ